MKAFEKELADLINEHNIEKVVDMPDFILADMLCQMIKAIGPSIKQNLDWHGRGSACQPAKETEGGEKDEFNRI